MPRFMITLRTTANGAFGSGLASTARYLVVPDGLVPDPSHAQAQGPWIAAVLATLAAPAGGPADFVGDILFVVHGFNESIADVVKLHDSVRIGLAAEAYNPTVISFDWPSDGKPYAYLPDLDTAAKSAIFVVNAAIKPLLRNQKPNCQVRINALAHSMGAFVMRAALGHADDGDFTGQDWMVGQLCLVAGDVEASSFVSGDNDTQSLMEHAYRLTNYYNPFDEALAISNAKRAGVEPRIGRVGLPVGAPDSTVNVNCGPRYATLPAQPDLITQAEFSHSWYFTDAKFFADLGQTLKGAVDRSVIAGRFPVGTSGYDLAV